MYDDQKKHSEGYKDYNPTSIDAFDEERELVQDLLNEKSVLEREIRSNEYQINEQQDNPDEDLSITEMLLQRREMLTDEMLVITSRLKQLL